MKLIKKICLLLMVAVLFSSYTNVNLEAQQDDELTITIDTVEVFFSDEYGIPFIDNANRTQVPIRVCMEAFGANVEWDSARNTAIVSYLQDVLEIPVGQKMITLNGRKIVTDTAAVIKNNRIYLPIRAVVEAFGSQIRYNNVTKTIEITNSRTYETDENIVSSLTDADRKRLTDYDGAVKEDDITSEWIYSRFLDDGQIVFSDDERFFTDKTLGFVKDDQYCIRGVYQKVVGQDVKEFDMEIRLRYQGNMDSVPIIVFDSYRTLGHVRWFNNKKVYYDEVKSNLKDVGHDQLVYEADRIISEYTNPSMTTFEKLKAIYQYMYFHTEVVSHIEGLEYKDAMYYTLLYHQGNDASIEQAFRYLLERVGIEYETNDAMTLAGGSKVVFYCHTYVTIGDNRYYFNVSNAIYEYELWEHFTAYGQYEFVVGNMMYYSDDSNGSWKIYEKNALDNNPATVVYESDKAPAHYCINDKYIYISSYSSNGYNQSYLVDRRTKEKNVIANIYSPESINGLYMVDDILYVSENAGMILNQEYIQCYRISKINLIDFKRTLLLDEILPDQVSFKMEEAGLWDIISVFNRYSLY